MAKDEDFLQKILEDLAQREGITISEIIRSKQYAKIGDALLRLAASLSLDNFGDGLEVRERVSNRFLKKIARSSMINKFLPKRMTEHDIGNAVEALLAFGWISRIVDLREIVTSYSDPELDTKIVNLIDTIIKGGVFFSEKGN